MPATVRHNHFAEGWLGVGGAVRHGSLCCLGTHTGRSQPPANVLSDAVRWVAHKIRKMLQLFKKLDPDQKSSNRYSVLDNVLRCLRKNRKRA